MAIINKLNNAAQVLYDDVPVLSNTVETLLALAPTLLKSVDKLTASIGDTLTYTVRITNLGLEAISNLAFTDHLPNGCNYVPDSFTVNSTAATPTVTGNELTYTIPTIAPLGVAEVKFQVVVVGGEE